MNITEVKVRKLIADGTLKAVVSVTLDNCFVIHDIKIISGNDGSWILLDKTSYIINADISYGLRYKNDELIDIKPYAGSKEPVKIPSSDLYPGYSNYEINHGFELSIKDSIEDERIPNGVNIGVIMHWC